MNTCNKCLKTFSNIGNLNKHLKMVHKDNAILVYEKDEKSFQCLEGCNISFRSNKDLITHLCTVHNLKMETEELHFPNIEEFHIFLNNLHISQNVEYVQTCGKQEKKIIVMNENGLCEEVIEIIYLKCNRSGKISFFAA